MLLDITYAHPNVFISNSACEKTQYNSMPPRRKLSDLDRGRAIGWQNCTHTLVIRWNHIKIWDHSIQNFVFGTSVNSWSLTYFEKYGTSVATLPDAWRYGVSAGTSWPGVSILRMGEIGHCIWSFYLSVLARTIVWADPSLRYTRMFLGR